MKELFTKKFWRDVKETYEDARTGKNEPITPQAPAPSPEPAVLNQPDPPLPKAE